MWFGVLKFQTQVQLSNISLMSDGCSFENTRVDEPY